MDLMTLAKGQEFDIYRMVKQRVGFKRSYDQVIDELKHAVLLKSDMDAWFWLGARPCPGFPSRDEQNIKEDIKEYLYNQVYDDRVIDNVRTSYLIRKSSNLYDEIGKKWAKSKGLRWCPSFRMNCPEVIAWIPDEILDEMKYYESLAVDIWHYEKLPVGYGINPRLFYPEFKEGLLDATCFCRDGMDEDVTSPY
jgi:hypothetical protein